MIDTTLLTKRGKILEDARIAKGLSKGGVAQRLETDSKTWNQWITSSDRIIQKAKQDALVKILGVSYDVLRAEPTLADTPEEPCEVISSPDPEFIEGIANREGSTIVFDQGLTYYKELKKNGLLSEKKVLVISASSNMEEATGFNPVRYCSRRDTTSTYYAAANMPELDTIEDKDERIATLNIIAGIFCLVNNWKYVLNVDATMEDAHKIARMFVSEREREMLVHKLSRINVLAQPLEYIIHNFKKLPESAMQRAEEILRKYAELKAFKPNVPLYGYFKKPNTIVFVECRKADATSPTAILSKMILSLVLNARADSEPDNVFITDVECVKDANLFIETIGYPTTYTLYMLGENEEVFKKNFETKKPARRSVFFDEKRRTDAGNFKCIKRASKEKSPGRQDVSYIPGWWKETKDAIPEFSLPATSKIRTYAKGEKDPLTGKTEIVLGVETLAKGPETMFKRTRWNLVTGKHKDAIFAKTRLLNLREDDGSRECYKILEEAERYGIGREVYYYLYRGCNAGDNDIRQLLTYVFWGMDSHKPYYEGDELYPTRNMLKLLLSLPYFCTSHCLHPSSEQYVYIEGCVATITKILFLALGAYIDDEDEQQKYIEFAQSMFCVEEDDECDEPPTRSDIAQHICAIEKSVKEDERNEFENLVSTAYSFQGILHDFARGNAVNISWLLHLTLDRYDILCHYEMCTSRMLQVLMDEFPESINYRLTPDELLDIIRTAGQIHKEMSGQSPRT